MKRFGLSLALACVALSVSACETTGQGVGINSPAPLSETKIDEQALITADRAFDVALDVVNLAVDVKLRIPGRAEQNQPFIPGTSAARQLASTIRSVDATLNAAASFARAGNTTSYLEALKDAQDGIAMVQTVIRTK